MIKSGKNPSHLNRTNPYPPLVMTGWQFRAPTCRSFRRKMLSSATDHQARQRGLSRDGHPSPSRSLGEQSQCIYRRISVLTGVALRVFVHAAKDAPDLCFDYQLVTCATSEDLESDPGSGWPLRPLRPPPTLRLPIYFEMPEAEQHLLIGSSRSWPESTPISSRSSSTRPVSRPGAATCCWCGVTRYSPGPPGRATRLRATRYREMRTSSRYHCRSGWTRSLRINNCFGKRNHATPTQPLFAPDDRPLYPPGPFALRMSFLRQLTGEPLPRSRPTIKASLTTYVLVSPNTH
jgi:hypothetical protein